MSVTINGTVCRNCWDVDWAKKVQREQIEKHQAEARKAQEAATAPPGSSQDASSGADLTSGSDKSATILGGALKGAAASNSVVPVGNLAVIAASSAPGRSLNIVA